MIEFSYLMTLKYFISSSMQNANHHLMKTKYFMQRTEAIATEFVFLSETFSWFYYKNIYFTQTIHSKSASTTLALFYYICLYIYSSYGRVHKNNAKFTIA